MFRITSNIVSKFGSARQVTPTSSAVSRSIIPGLSQTTMHFSTKDSTKKSGGLDIALFNKLKEAKKAKHEQLLSEITAIEDLAEKIDTSLTIEEQEHVNKLKKILKGAAAKPSIYRDVPKPHEIREVSNFVPNVPKNAEALIDFALSHIPPATGPRRSKHKKRMNHRMEAKRKQAKKRKEQEHAAWLKKQEKQKRIRLEIKAIKEEARLINEKRAAARAVAGKA